MNEDNSARPLLVNLTVPNSRSQLKGRAPLISSQKLGWKDVNFSYYRYGNCEIPTHIFEHHAVGLILNRGKVERKLDGIYKMESTNVGSVAVIPTDVEHWSAWKGIGRFAMFSIAPQALAQVEPETADPDRIELIPTFATQKPDRLIHGIGLAIQDYLINNPDSYSIYIEHLNNALTAHLLQNYCNIKPTFREYSGGLASHKLKLATDYINDNLGHNIKLIDLANLLDLSQYYFSHLFRESTGLSPYRYIIRQRVEKAKRLLKHSNLPIVDIAQSCGFNSQSQMTQHFRKQTGMTPKKYRDTQQII